MISRAIALLVPLSPFLDASVRSGHAEVAWLGATETYEPGKSVNTAFKMTIDPHWHTYWVNPGEGGMKLGVSWELPAGWEAEYPQHPTPKRFMTGELPGFGYEGTVMFPVSITAPPDAAEPVTLKAKLSWLTCNDDSCVPGDAELTLTLAPGEPGATEHAPLIKQAFSAIPRHHEGWNLTVTENNGQLTLTVTTPDDTDADLSRSEAFPATENTIDSGAEIKFTKSGARWTSTVPKSEYSGGPVEKLALVLGGPGLETPIALSWPGK